MIKAHKFNTSELQRTRKHENMTRKSEERQIQVYEPSKWQRGTQKSEYIQDMAKSTRICQYDQELYTKHEKQLYILEIAKSTDNK